ncbi:MAG: hypothetical protein ACRDZU_10735 [Acidimicrobiales bacterium]
MPMVATVLLAWFTASAVLSPLVGMLLAEGGRRQVAGADRLRRAELVL